MGLFHPLPHFASGWCVNFFFDKCVTQVFTFLVVHVTRDSVLTIWSQVDGDAHILILSEITFHSSGGIERFDDRNTLFFQSLLLEQEVPLRRRLQEAEPVKVSFLTLICPFQSVQKSSKRHNLSLS